MRAYSRAMASEPVGDRPDVTVKDMVSAECATCQWSSIGAPDIVRGRADAHVCAPPRVVSDAEYQAALVAQESDVDMVNHPPHYRHPSGIECIVFTRHLSFDAGNAFKYVWRADAKNGRQDLEKARWYLLDGTEHADQPFLRSWNFTVQRQLSMVLEHETEPDRRAFFDAFKRGDLGRALDAVNSMLGDV